MKTQENIAIGMIPGEFVFQETLYESIYKYKNLIYLIPCWAKKISVYDLESQKFYFIELKNYTKYQNKLLFKNVYPNGKYLYCIPYSYQAIIKLDMEYGTIEYIEFNYLGEGYICNSSRWDNKIIATWNKSNYLLVLDLETDKIYLKEYGEKQREYTKICQNKQNLYLFDDYNGELLKINKNQKQIELLWKCAVHDFRMYILQNQLVIDFAHNHKKIVINLQNKKIMEVSIDTNIPDMVLRSTYKTVILESGKDLTKYLYDCDKNKWVQYEGTEINKEFVIEKKELKQIIKNIKMQSLMAENELFHLTKWIYKIDEIKCENEIQYKAFGEIVKDHVKNFWKR